MSRRLDRGASLVRLLVIVVVVGAVVRGWLGEPDVPRPGPDGQAAGSAVSGVSYVDVTVPLPQVRGRTRFNDKSREAGKVYTGTAFATAADTVWATARHVAEGCRRTELRRGGRKRDVVRIVHDEATDLSLLYAPTGGALVAASRDFLPLERPGLEGFAMGYPRGREASVHLAYLARIAAGRADRRGRERWAAAGLWQIRQTGLFTGPNLAGISGGPLFDRHGGLIGIVVGGQPRRARVTSIDPVNLRAFMKAAGTPAARRAWQHPGIAPDNANDVRRDLIHDGLLAQVVCYT